MTKNRNAETKREIGTGSGTSIVVASIIGAGIFTTSGIILYHLISSGQSFSEIPMNNYNGIIYMYITL